MAELTGATERTRSASLTDFLRLRGKEQSAAAVIVLAWATVVMPSLVQSFTAPKNRNFTSDTETASAASSLVNLALTVGLSGLLLLLLVRYLNDLPVDRRGILVVLLLPWLYQVSRDVFAGTPLRLGGLLYPLIVVVIWILRPRLQQLAVLGYLIGLTALISVLMGALDPAKGILSSTEGSIITPDKQLLPWGILIGPLTDGNPLGQFLALGLPAAVYIQRHGWRWAIFLVTSFAVLWTSNRSSLAALGAGLAVSALLKIAPRGTRRLSTAVLIFLFAGIVAYLPLTTTQNDAFTNRGYIWTASLRHWESHPLTGLGSQWYSQSAKYANNIGPTAFHGHNLFVQILVLGGLINLALIGIMLIALIRVAARWSEFRAVTVPAAFLCMLLTSGALEVSLSFVHRSFLLPVTLLTITYMCFAAEEREDAVPDVALPSTVTAVATRPTPGSQSRSTSIGGQEADDSEFARQSGAVEPVEPVWMTAEATAPMRVLTKAFGRLTAGPTAGGTTAGGPSRAGRPRDAPTEAMPRLDPAKPAYPTRESSREVAPFAFEPPLDDTAPIPMNDAATAGQAKEGGIPPPSADATAPLMLNPATSKPGSPKATPPKAAPSKTTPPKPASPKTTPPKPAEPKPASPNAVPSKTTPPKPAEPKPASPETTVKRTEPRPEADPQPDPESGAPD